MKETLKGNALRCKGWRVLSFEVIHSKAKVLPITSGKVGFPEVIVVASTAKSREFFVVSRNKRPR